MTTYPTNFVSKVIARVDFQPILKLKQEPVDFQEIIREQFPRFSHEGIARHLYKAWRSSSPHKNSYLAIYK